MITHMPVAAPALIDPATPFVIVDTKTGGIVYRTTYANRLRARRWADRKDQEWGAYRYASRTEFATATRNAGL